MIIGYLAGVQEAAAVGVADARLGELVTALVTVKPEHKKRVDVEGLMDVARKKLVHPFSLSLG